MTDLVERLRDPRRWYNTGMFNEAADEIERLNERVAAHERHVTGDAVIIANLQVTLEACQAALRDAMSELTEARDEIERLQQGVDVVCADICAENDNMRDENERLRTALGALVNDSMYKDHPEASQMAIDALERKS